MASALPITPQFMTFSKNFTKLIILLYLITHDTTAGRYVKTELMTAMSLCAYMAIIVIE